MGTNPRAIKKSSFPSKNSRNHNNGNHHNTWNKPQHPNHHRILPSPPALHRVPAASQFALEYQRFLATMQLRPLRLWLLLLAGLTLGFCASQFSGSLDVSMTTALGSYSGGSRSSKWDPAALVTLHLLKSSSDGQETNRRATTQDTPAADAAANGSGNDGDSHSHQALRLKQRKDDVHQHSKDNPLMSFISGSRPRDKPLVRSNDDKPLAHGDKDHHMAASPKKRLHETEDDTSMLPNKKRLHEKKKDNPVASSSASARKLVQNKEHKSLASSNKSKLKKTRSIGSAKSINKLVAGDDDTAKLLDFAIVGFSKCATSFMMHWLRQQSEEISISKKEVCHLNKQKDAALLDHLQHDLDADKKRGFKCPSHFTRTSLNWYRRYFPHTKLIVGLRHPVLWLESFYNYRLRHPKRGNFTLPNDPNQLLVPLQTSPGSPCPGSFQGVCPQYAYFHQQLARLVKTPLEKEERALLQLPARDIVGLSQRRVENPVFLYDISQLSDPDNELARDLAQFLGLERSALRPYVAEDESDDDDRTVKRRFNICQDEYQPLRDELMKASRQASQWILEYFLPHVTVSSPDKFAQILKNDWNRDPCEARNNKKKLAAASAA